MIDFEQRKDLSRVQEKKRKFNINMRILISITVMISDYKIKIKNIILIETFNKIFDKNHVISDDFSNETAVN